MGRDDLSPTDPSVDRQQPFDPIAREPVHHGPSTGEAEHDDMPAGGAQTAVVAFLLLLFLCIAVILWTYLLIVVLRTN